MSDDFQHAFRRPDDILPLLVAIYGKLRSIEARLDALEPRHNFMVYWQKGFHEINEINQPRQIK